MEMKTKKEKQNKKNKENSPMPLIKKCNLCGELHDANRGTGDWEENCPKCNKEFSSQP